MTNEDAMTAAIRITEVAATMPVRLRKRFVEAVHAKLVLPDAGPPARALSVAIDRTLREMNVNT
jgi:hypothetical protein